MPPITPEDFQADLPRSLVTWMDGSDLPIAGRGDKGKVIISDGVPC